MEAKTIEDLLKAHHEFVEQVQQRLAVLGKNDPPSDEQLIREKQELLAHFQQRLKDANEAKKRSAQHYDEEIARHKAMVTRLEKEIREAGTPAKPASRRKPRKRG